MEIPSPSVFDVVFQTNSMRVLRSVYNVILYDFGLPRDSDSVVRVKRWFWLGEHTIIPTRTTQHSPTQHLETNDDAKSRARTIAVAITSSSHGSISSSSSCLLNTVQ